MYICGSQVKYHRYLDCRTCTYTYTYKYHTCKSHAYRVYEACIMRIPRVSSVLLVKPLQDVPQWRRREGEGGGDTQRNSEVGDCCVIVER